MEHLNYLIQEYCNFYLNFRYMYKRVVTLLLVVFPYFSYSQQQIIVENRDCKIVIVYKFSTDSIFLEGKFINKLSKTLIICPFITAGSNLMNNKPEKMYVKCGVGSPDIIGSYSTPSVIKLGANEVHIFEKRGHQVPEMDSFTLIAYVDYLNFDELKKKEKKNLLVNSSLGNTPSLYYKVSHKNYMSNCCWLEYTIPYVKAKKGQGLE